MSLFKTLRGFEHFGTQSSFEEWQLKYPDYVIDLIQPMKNKVIFSKYSTSRCNAGYNGIEPVYGIFITYSYLYKIEKNEI